MVRGDPAVWRVGLVGRSEVWEVCRVVRSARAAERQLGNVHVVVAGNAVDPIRRALTAWGYSASFPFDVAVSRSFPIRRSQC